MINRFGVTKHSTNKFNRGGFTDTNNVKYEKEVDSVHIDVESTPTVTACTATEKTPLLLNRKSLPSTSTSSTTQSVKKNVPSKRFSYLKLMGIALLLVGGCSIGVYLLSHERKYLSGYTIDLVNREVWNTRKTLNLESVNNLNASHVIVMEVNADHCDDSIECFELFQRFSKIENQLQNYNFLILSNGQIYEILGWDHISKLQSIIQNESLIIGFIDDYTNNDFPTEEQLKSFISLIFESIRRGKLQMNYRLLVVRNLTISPFHGEDLYNEISKWDHFDNLIEVQ